MDKREVAKSLLSCVNDRTFVQEYGDGLIVDLPLLRRDGDHVRLLIEPDEGSLRVTDRGDGIDLAVEDGLNPESNTAKASIQQILRALNADRIGADDFEASVLTTADRVGCQLLEVATASLRLEALHVLAQEREQQTFSAKISNVLSSLFGTRAEVKQRGKMPMRANRTRQVTASVSTKEATAYVQAVSRKNEQGAVASAFYLFSHSLAPQPSRVSAFQGSRDTWDPAAIEDLSGVSTVVFPDDSAAELEAVVSGALAPA